MCIFHDLDYVKYLELVGEKVGRTNLNDLNEQDIDVHHGDEVEEVFFTTNRVMTVFFHQFDMASFLVLGIFIWWVSSFYQCANETGMNDEPLCHFSKIS